VETSGIYVLHLERKSRHNEGNHIRNGLANNETECGDTLLRMCVNWVWKA